MDGAFGERGLGRKEVRGKERKKERIEIGRGEGESMYTTAAAAATYPGGSTLAYQILNDKSCLQVLRSTLDAGRLGRD